MPIEAYWTEIDWKSLGAAAVAITGVAFPFLKDTYKDWYAGRAVDAQSAAKIAETAAERQDRINREQYDRIEAERKYHADLAIRNAVALAACEARTVAAVAEADARTDQAKREARAMEDWAHWYRHGWANMQQRFISLLSLADRALTGDITPERARANYDQIQAALPEAPPAVPLLHEAHIQKPPR